MIENYFFSIFWKKLIETENKPRTPGDGKQKMEQKTPSKDMVMMKRLSRFNEERVNIS